MRQEASASARFAAQQIEFVLQGQQAPVVAIATAIKQNPNIVELNQHFQFTMGSLLRQVGGSGRAIKLLLHACMHACMHTGGGAGVCGGGVCMWG
jgi:hypothetical protein